jgi:hypothetical protein
VVDNITYVGGNIEIEVDSLGKVHLTYFDGSANELVYALGTPIPEPATIALLGIGIGAMASFGRKKGTVETR